MAVGDRVATSATLCQLEAFKVFTPIRLADFNSSRQTALYDPALAFEVTRVNVASGAQVSAGDLLFVVRPVTASPVTVTATPRSRDRPRRSGLRPNG